MIPLVLGLGATFIILMGSIDLSVEGVLALGAVILSCSCSTAPTATISASLGVAVVLAVGRAAWASSTASST